MTLSITNNDSSSSSGPTSVDVNQVTGSLEGDVTGSLTDTQIAPGVIENVHINDNANIPDSKLALIFSPGKVSNSATSATSANTVNAIVLRAADGSFSAGNITSTGVSVSGNLTANNTTINGSVTSNIATINGNITTNSATITNTLNSGSITTSNATINNTLTANNATVSGAINTGTITTSGNATVNGNATISGNINANSMSTNSATINGNMNVNNTTISGNMSANSATINGSITSGNATINGSETVNGNATINGNLIVTGTINTSMVSLTNIGTTPLPLGSGSQSIGLIDLAVFYYENGTSVWESGCFSIAWGRSSASSAFNPSIFSASRNITLNPNGVISEAVGFRFLTLETSNEFRITFDGSTNTTSLRMMSNPNTTNNKLVLYITARVSQF